MAYYNDTFVVYLLIDISEPRYVGIARSHLLDHDIQKHRMSKPAFAVQIIQRGMKLGDAEELAKKYIAHYFTDKVGWNKNGLESPRLPNAAQQPGVTKPHMKRRYKFDPNSKERLEKVSAAHRQRAKFIDPSGRLPSRKGEKWSSKSKDKLRTTCVGRRRKYNEDGSWTWTYENHPTYGTKTDPEA